MRRQGDHDGVGKKGLGCWDQCMWAIFDVRGQWVASERGEFGVEGKRSGV